MHIKIIALSRDNFRQGSGGCLATGTAAYQQDGRDLDENGKMTTTTERAFASFDQIVRCTDVFATKTVMYFRHLALQSFHHLSKK